MARDLVNDTYYTAKGKGGKIPVKWTAPEVYYRTTRIMPCINIVYVILSLLLHKRKRVVFVISMVV